MTYTEACFSLKSGFKKIVLTTAKPGVEYYGGLLNNRACALKYHLTISESPNLQVHYI